MTPFAFYETVVSGSRIDTHGVSQGILAIATGMQSMGWSIYDDQLTDPSDSRIVMYNEEGETTSSGIYLVVASGSTSSIYFQIANSWDAGVHQADDLITPTVVSSIPLPVTHDTSWVLWTSGDKDSVTIVNKVENVYYHIIAGRGENFLGPDLEPYGVYLKEGGEGTPGATDVRGIVGNPPQTLLIQNEGEFLVYPIAASNSPRTGLQGDEEDVILSALPLLFVVDDTSPLRKGAISIVKNVWNMRGTDIGVMSEMVFTVEGSSEEYMAFAGTYALVIRRA